MPNWVRNTIKITERKDEFKALVLDEKGEFDFNRIIPKPIELDINSGSGSYEPTDKECSCPEGSIGYFSYQVCKNIQPILDKLYNEEISQKEFADKVVSETEENPKFVWENVEPSDRNKDVRTKACGYWNIKRYDWYAWSWDNWGTKWNACGETYVVDNDDLYISFDTAWNTPDRIWEKLVSLGFKFTVAFADEDYGSNLGIINASEDFFSLEDFSDLPLIERQYVSDLIYSGVDTENEEDYYGFNEEISTERQEELLESVKEYLM